MIKHTSSAVTPRQEPGLVRQLGLTSATALVVAEVIGVGIFLTTAGMVKSLGSPFWLLSVWLTMGMAAAGGAICFGALAARRPEDGGPYVYLKEAYGRRVAFLFGWLSMLVTDPGITAAVAVGLARYVSYLVPLSPWGFSGRRDWLDLDVGGGQHPRRQLGIRRDPWSCGAQARGSWIPCALGPVPWPRRLVELRSLGGAAAGLGTAGRLALIGGMIAAFFSSGRLVGRQQARR